MSVIMSGDNPDGSVSICLRWSLVVPGGGQLFDGANSHLNHLSQLEIKSYYVLAVVQRITKSPLGNTNSFVNMSPQMTR